MSGCTAYVLRQPPESKFEARAYERAYLETMNHGVYKKSITNKDGASHIVESRHVTFDESRFIGAPASEEYMNNDYESVIADYKSEDGKAVYIDVSGDKISDTGVPVIESESRDTSKYSSSSIKSKWNHDAGTDIDPQAGKVS